MRYIEDGFHTYCLTKTPDIESGEGSEKISPRPKKISKKEQNATRARAGIVQAARDLFVDAGFHHTSVEDVAERAGVARATVYYQFKSKSGLLDAVIGQAQKRGASDIDEAFAEHPDLWPDPLEALGTFIEQTCQVWEADRPLFRRVVGLALVDPKVSRVVDAREKLRGYASKELGLRLTGRYSQRITAQALWAVTNFANYDSIRSRASFEQTAEILTHMAMTLVDPAGLSRGRPVVKDGVVRWATPEDSRG